MKFKLILASICSVLSITTYAGNSSNCKQFYFGGYQPIISNMKMNKNTQLICFSGFSVNYSKTSKSSLWAAEFITPDILRSARGMTREDNFHEESRLPLKDRSLLSDFQGSGYDRGHLAPNGNRANVTDQYESFSMVNIISQAPKNNQNQWRNVEEATRTLITKLKEPAYIITGPLYLSSKVKTIGNKVMVPSHIYKVVYFPNLNIASAYVSVNDNLAKTEVVTLSQLQQVSGIVLIPKLQGTKLMNQRFDLPLSANAAYKMREFKLLPTHTTNVFETMPNEAYLPEKIKYSGKNKQTDISDILKYQVNKIEKKHLNSNKKILSSLW